MKKKLLILIPIIIALILAATAFLLLSKKPDPQPQLDMDKLISDVVKTNPEYTEQEVRDFLNTPLTQEQQQAIQDSINEFEEKMDVQGVPIDEIPEEELNNIFLWF